MSVYHNREEMTMMAKHLAVEHNCNYNIILRNPDLEGQFQLGSTYEMVADSYFDKDRPNVKLLDKTDDLLRAAEPTTVTEVDVPNIDGSFPCSLASYDDVYTITRHQNSYDKSNMSKTERDAIIVPVRNTAKTHRNQLCPCNSGMKFKRCCNKPKS